MRNKPLSARRRGRLGKNPNHVRDGQVATAWLMSAPALVLMGLFIVLPFGMSLAYSFTNRMMLMSARNPLKLVGFSNYARVFTTELNLTALWNTVRFTLYVVPAILVLSLLLALMLNKRVKRLSWFRMFYFAPQLVSLSVVSVVWSFILSSSPDGMFNTLLGLFGVAPQEWLKSPSLAMESIAIMTVWTSVGFYMLSFLSALQFVPPELYEAAEIDGASGSRCFFHITLPMLSNTIAFVLISNVIYSLRLFTQIYMLTKGGPMNSTFSIVYLIYESGFQKNQIGYSSALAVVFFLLIMSISSIQTRMMLQRKED